MISFMYEPIRRFHDRPEFKTHLDQLYGTTEWQQCMGMDETDEKKQFLHGLFQKQLKRKGAKHVVHFELWKDNRHVYTIYFTTGHAKGCDLMKQAVWRADPTGSYTLRGHAGRQGFLFGTDTEPLTKQLKDQFGHRATSIEKIEAFVMSDETIFHKGQLRKETLRPLEKQGRIAVNRPQGARGFACGKRITVRFN